MSGEGRRVQWETKQTHPGKSQNPVAKMAGAEETNPLKPIWQRYYQSICEPLGRNESERTGSFERLHLEGRTRMFRVKAAGRNETLTDALRHLDGVIATA